MFGKNKNDIQPVKPYALPSANRIPVDYVHASFIKALLSDCLSVGRKLISRFTKDQLDEHSGSIMDGHLHAEAEAAKASIDVQYHYNQGVIEHQYDVLMGEKQQAEAKIKLLEELEEKLDSLTDHRLY